MHLLCVIPARIGSTRLAEKPLRQIARIPLVSLVASRVNALGLEAEVVVATDDRRVARLAEQTGVRAELTDPRHRSGTERVAEVITRGRYAGADIVVNVQGDEPFIPAEAVRGALARVFEGDPVGTAAAPLPPERVGHRDRVKVMIDRDGHAVRFSRAPLPSGEGVSSEYLQHIGVYAYTRSALLDWVRSPPVVAETTERLEQLRPLAHGMRIGVALIEGEAPAGIDTEDDLRSAEAYLLAQERGVNA
jgi:3-deoxy-manno-octulosonate cytidylyltransferase (CMP-KDO synthetase)